ncbi:MAG: MoxR-like ATPase [Mycobacterium sp.]|nr:MoxR-like ATPase [Mycobacterium sp.]
MNPNPPADTTADEDAARNALRTLRTEIAKAVVGQDAVVSGLVIALLCRGHVLLEGVPGVAKTLLVRTLAAALQLEFKRVQFTPDLMPGDITGSLVYDARTAEFEFRSGPVFTNLLLADEINRTPPKTQAALLEAMEERQVSVDGEPRPLPDPFIVAATQNPIEYEGTYQLPEAQLDRFL